MQTIARALHFSRTFRSQRRQVNCWLIRTRIKEWIRWVSSFSSTIWPFRCAKGRRQLSRSTFTKVIVAGSNCFVFWLHLTPGISNHRSYSDKELPTQPRLPTPLLPPLTKVGKLCVRPYLNSWKSFSLSVQRERWKQRDPDCLPVVDHDLISLASHDFIILYY